jgi:PHD-like zinc-binding domain
MILLSYAQMVPEAVRRGRKIKCRECGGKGATLGCLNRFCRSSFHLSCARNCGCELQVRSLCTWPRQS